MFSSKNSRLLPWFVVIGSMAGIATSVCARDGDPDRSFGTTGSVFRSFPGGLAIEQSMVDAKVLPSGKLLISATVKTGTSAAFDFGVMRLNANGSIDTSFGDAGGRVVGFDRAGSDNNDGVYRMAIQPNGRILMVGTAAGGVGGYDMAAVRLNADGSLDTSFGTGGKTTVAFDLGATAESRADVAIDIMVLPDGRIVLGGNATTAAGSVMAIARLTASGVLDTTFDGDGKRTVNFGGSLSDDGIAYKLLASTDGQRMYAAGFASLAGNFDFAIARLLSNGSLDTTFAGDGGTTFGFDIGGSLTDGALEAVELPDGKLLVCGFSVIAAPSNTDFSCVRLLANGTVDSDFQPPLIPFDLDNSKLDQAYATRIDAQGRIMMGGLASAGPGTYDFAVARLLPSGQVDPSFGIDGRMTYDGETENVNNYAYALALQGDEKIVVAGWAVNAQSLTQVQVVRLIGDTLFESNFEAAD